jgi:hypothetical protein
MRRYGRTASVFKAADTREWRGHDVVDAGGCPSIGTDGERRLARS